MFFTCNSLLSANMLYKRPEYSYRPGMAAEERLLLHLFNNGYDPDARGVVNPNYTVNVEVNFLLLRIQRLVSEILLVKSEL